MEIIKGEPESIEEGSTFFVLGEDDKPLDTFGLQLVAQFMIAQATYENPGKTFLFRECVGWDEETGEEREAYELVEIDAVPTNSTAEQSDEAGQLGSMHDAA